MGYLMVRHGNGRKDLPFHPTLKINPHSGFCPNQWQEMCFRPGTFIGHGCVRQVSVAEAVTEYFRELKRMDHVPVDIDREDAELFSTYFGKLDKIAEEDL